MSTKKTTISDFVELTGGGKLYLLPVSEADVQAIMIATRNEFAKQGRPVDPPTYTTEAGELFAWDAASVEKDGTDEDKAAWAAYVQAADDLTGEQEKRVMYHVLTESPYQYVTAKGNPVDLVIDEVDGEWTPPAGWLKKQQATGYVLPEDAYTRKADFLNSIIKGVVQKREIITRAMALSLRGVVSDEGIAAYEATFRGQMEKAGRAAEERLLAAIEGVNDLAGGKTAATGAE